MRGRIATILIFSAALCSPLEAHALRANASCRVVAGEKYLGADGSASLCREIEQAIATQAPNASYTAEVTALSPTRLAARLTVNGKVLPEHKFAVMDAELGLESMKRFARALAGDIAKAVKK